jgi:hypothetical protein
MTLYTHWFRPTHSALCLKTELSTNTFKVRLGAPSLTLNVRIDYEVVLTKTGGHGMNVNHVQARQR